MAKRLSELFVSRLSFYTTEESFREMFSPYGLIRQARLVKDPRTGRNKGFGFVAYESEDDARRALKAMNGRVINNRLIFVEFANSRENGENADH
ncbi:hypothetical protein MLD38_040132 [Melastoma candidum]|uniref:Uncharacterized protein n=1 Tax=Melastoma candidum TaxID=119954 RepID=A0ACB9L518_9MYRT|nr:hypothetical protein MLD38_040132 [Melastoma candidum]